MSLDKSHVVMKIPLICCQRLSLCLSVETSHIFLPFQQLDLSVYFRQSNSLGMKQTALLEKCRYHSINLRLNSKAGIRSGYNFEIWIIMPWKWNIVITSKGVRSIWQLSATTEAVLMVKKGQPSFSNPRVCLRACQCLGLDVVESGVSFFENQIKSTPSD